MSALRLDCEWSKTREEVIPPGEPYKEGYKENFTRNSLTSLTAPDFLTIYLKTYAH